VQVSLYGGPKLDTPDPGGLPMDLSYLKDLSDRYTSDNSGNAQKLPHLSVYRRHAESDMEAVVYDPVVCLILQGSKTAGTNSQRVTLETGDALLVSHDLPVVSQITRASAREPYIAVLLSLDLGLVRSLSLELDGAPPAHGHVAPLAAGPADPAWLTPLIRYFELIDDPQAARVLGPAIVREIHFRLLLSDLGRMLSQLMYTDSHACLIAKAIQVIRNDFRSQLSIPDLARTAGMSGSSFHSNFKSVTGITPLQFQKDLRLIEARAQLTENGQSVSNAAYMVGYESPTHFSRDYSRKFGISPSRDAQQN